MKPILKNLDTNSRFSVDELCELDGQVFANWLNASIGPEDLPGADDFQIFICTSDWLEREKNNFNSLPEKYLVVEGKCSPETITETITRFIGSCEENTWPEIARLISMRANWEYEGY